MISANVITSLSDVTRDAAAGRSNDRGSATPSRAKTYPDPGWALGNALYCF